MWERIIIRLKRTFPHLRVALFLVLAVHLLYVAKQLDGVYIQKPVTPLVKLAEGQGVASNNEIKVNISGAVNKPGVYSFKSEAQRVVADVISQAGGLSKDADKAYVAKQINLARSVANGDHIYIPSLQEQKLAEVLKQSPTDSKLANQNAGEKVNLNTATASELQTLPGVGPSMAEKIIAARPFTTVEELNDISGVGDVTFTKLKDLVTV